MFEYPISTGFGELFFGDIVTMYQANLRRFYERLTVRKGRGNSRRS